MLCKSKLLLIFKTSSNYTNFLGCVSSESETDDDGTQQSCLPGLSSGRYPMVSRAILPRKRFQHL